MLNLFKTLKKFSLLIGLLILTSFSFAQSCPNEIQNFDNINVTIDPIKFDYSKTSKEIQELGKQQSKSHLLGLYNSQKQLIINPLLKSSKESNANQWCGVFSTVSVKISATPIIYIAKEAQQFQCTLNRVKEHEMTHHTFEIKAFSQAKTNISLTLKKYYSGNVLFSTNEEASQIIKQKNALAINEINKFLESISKPLHNSIDTEDNYKRESAICSQQENIQLTKILLKQ